MALAGAAPTSGRELLHRVAMLLGSDLSIQDVVERFALMLSSATGAQGVSIALRNGERQFIAVGPAPGEGAVGLAIMANGQEIGELHVCWPERQSPDDHLVTVLDAAATYLGARVQHEFDREERDRLKQIASTDALTGLANRRTFDETLAREWARCGRSGSSLSVLLLDVDFFKVYNDTYGHIAGDQCLQRIARAIASCVKRPGDVACRYGGEEFAVVLPETEPRDAMRVAETICETVRREQVEHQGSSLGYATVSIGCAGVVPDAQADPPSLTEAADAQLYRAKEHGRNRVASADVLGDAPVAERQTGPRSNLPAAHNLFFGRDGDVDVMAALLGDARLLTIAGPGGVGKTRLSVEFARRHAGDYRDGVFFVDLAAIADGALVTPTICETLGLKSERDGDDDDSLAAALHDKRMLVVLDNCEQLADRVALLIERLLTDAGETKFVVTSRRPLHIDGEHVYRLATLQQGDAVALFSSRAQAVMPSFALNAANIESVKAICAKLSGIPLAIELAAARVRTINVQELETELVERAHSRTVSDTIEWSYGILSAEEKRLMRSLSIFAGAFALEDARRVCIDDGDTVDVIDVIGRLIDKSLVHADPVEGRYWLLETTREFGRRMLDQHGELSGIRARYTSHLIDVAGAAEKQFAKGAGDDGRIAVAAHYADFRAAMESALRAGSDASKGAQLVASLGWYWTERGLWREGRYWLDLTLRHAVDDLGVELAARLLLASAVAYYVQGDFAAMEREAKRTFQVYARFGDRIGMASAQNLMAIAAQFAGRMQDAYDLWQSVLSASKDVQNVRLEAVVLGNLAEVVSDWKADYAESERLYARASEIHRQLSNSFPLAVTLGDWSATAAYQGDLRRAEHLAAEALDIFRGFDEEMRVIEQLIRIAHYRIWAGRFGEAKRTLREVVEQLSSASNPLYAVRAAEALAELALASGSASHAAQLLAFADAQRSLRRLARPAPIESRLQGIRGQLPSVGDPPNEADALRLAREVITQREG